MLSSHSIDKILSPLKELPKWAQIVSPILSLLFAFNLLFAGYFSKIPPEFIILLGVKSTAAIAFEVTLKLAVSVMFAKIAYAFVRQVTGTTHLISGIMTFFRFDEYRSRTTRLLVRRFVRRMSMLLHLIFAVSFFSLSLLNFDMVIGFLGTVLAAMLFLPFLLYPVFFRPTHLRFPPPFFLAPLKPKGVSERRWSLYLLSCVALIVGWCLYDIGKELFTSRVSQYVSVEMDSETFVGSLVASNSSGILLVSKNNEAKYWQVSKREFYYFPFSGIVSIRH